MCVSIYVYKNWLEGTNGPPECTFMFLFETISNSDGDIRHKTMEIRQDREKKWTARFERRKKKYTA